MRYAKAYLIFVFEALALMGLLMLISRAQAPTLLPNQYAGMPPRASQAVQYCQHVCTQNVSGSMFGGPRNPANICQVHQLIPHPDGTPAIFTGSTLAHPDGIEVDTLTAPDGSRCIWEAPQCNPGNGCQTAWTQCRMKLNIKTIASGSDPCWKLR